jgi:hypothetical protein
MPGEGGRAPPPTADEAWPSDAPFGEAGRISVSIIVLAFLCSSAGSTFASPGVILNEPGFAGGIRSASGAQLVRQLPPRGSSQFTAGGRIQPRAAIRPRAAAASHPMWTPLLAATKCAHQPLHPLPQSLLTCYCSKSAERSRLTHSRRVAHRPWAAGPVRSLAANGRQ